MSASTSAPSASRPSAAAVISIVWSQGVVHGASGKATTGAISLSVVVLLLGEAGVRRDDQVGRGLDELLVRHGRSALGVAQQRGVLDVGLVVGLFDPRQQVALADGPGLLGDGDRVDAGRDRGLGRTPAPRGDALGRLGDDGLAECVLDRDREALARGRGGLPARSRSRRSEPEAQAERASAAMAAPATAIRGRRRRTGTPWFEGSDEGRLT